MSINKEFLVLSLDERISLIEELWDSITDEQDSVPISSAQKDELEKRLDILMKDSDAGTDWESVKKRILMSYE